MSTPGDQRLIQRLRAELEAIPAPETHGRLRVAHGPPYGVLAFVLTLAIAAALPLGILLRTARDARDAGPTSSRAEDVTSSPGSVPPFDPAVLAACKAPMGPDSPSLAGTAPFYVTFVREPQGYIGPELATGWTREPFVLWLYIDNTVDSLVFSVESVGEAPTVPASPSGRQVQIATQLRRADADGDRGTLWFVRAPVRFPAPGCYEAVFAHAALPAQRVTIRIDPP